MMLTFDSKMKNENCRIKMNQTICVKNSKKILWNSNKWNSDLKNLIDQCEFICYSEHVTFN